MISTLKEQSSSDLLPAHFTNPQVTHILEYAIRHIRPLESKNASYFNGQCNEAELKFFCEKILPEFKNIIEHPPTIDPLIKQLHAQFKHEQELGQFWAYVAITSFQRGQILYEDESANNCLETFVNKLRSALARKESSHADIQALYFGFMGELVRTSNSMSVRTIHLLFNLVRCVSPLNETSKSNMDISFVIGSCLVCGLNLQGKLSSRKKYVEEDEYLLAQKCVMALMDLKIFDQEYDPKTYKNRIYPQEPSIVDKFRSLSFSFKKKSKSEADPRRLSPSIFTPPKAEQDSTPVKQTKMILQEQPTCENVSTPIPETESEPKVKPIVPVRHTPQYKYLQQTLRQRANSSGAKLQNNENNADVAKVKPPIKPDFS